MQAPLALFNGSYVGERPTGIGVVARELAAALGPQRAAEFSWRRTSAELKQRLRALSA